jgi:hypothetical protein
LSLVWIFSICSSLVSNTSHMRWYFTSMCFYLEWFVELLLRWIALWLSQ